MGSTIAISIFRMACQKHTSMTESRLRASAFSVTVAFVCSIPTNRIRAMAGTTRKSTATPQRSVKKRYESGQISWSGLWSIEELKLKDEINKSTKIKMAPIESHDYCFIRLVFDLMDR